MNVRVIPILIGLACTLAFLAFAIHRVSLGSVAAVLANANPIWIAAAMIAYTVNLSLRARRWQVILRPVAALAYTAVARALLVGYGLNTIMPARLGELFRAEFLNRTVGLSRVWALTSIVIERLFDGVTVVLCLGLGLFLTTGSHDADLLGNVLITGSIIFGAALAGALGLSGSRMTRAFSRFPALSAQLNRVRSGFEILRTWRTLEVAALTLVIYLPDALSLWFIVKAVGLPLGFAGTLVLVGAASLSTLLPSGPAFLGTLQFAYVLTIEFAGGTPAIGFAAATPTQLCLFLPIAIVATRVLIQRSGSLLQSLLRNSDRPLTPRRITAGRHSE